MVTVGEPETEGEVFNKVEVERLGTETLGVKDNGTVEIELERLNERVSESFPTVDTGKPELERVGIGRVIVVSRENSVVETERVLRDVKLLKGGVTA